LHIDETLLLTDFLASPWIHSSSEKIPTVTSKSGSGSLSVWRTPNTVPGFLADLLDSPTIF